MPFFRSLELLEDRIAPASLVSAKVVTYEDVDGSDVTIKLSKPLFTSANVNSILHFDTGTVDGTSTPQQLQLIDLTAAAGAQGVSISVTARHDAVHGGDALANVGAINATGLDLGKVSIAGDLGEITAGVAGSGRPSMTSLSVQSMGEYGLSTQAAGGTLTSQFIGSVPSIVVRGDVANAFLHVLGSSTAPNIVRVAAAAAADTGSINSLTILGSVIGSDTADQGHISVSGKIGKLSVGGDLRGGTSANTGEISASGAIGTVTVNGSLLGNTGSDSGSIQSLTSIGNVTVRHDVRGGDGGTNETTGEDSGVIDGGGALGAVKVLGSVVGGGPDSGSIRAESINGHITSIYIGGDLEGGGGAGSGYLHAETKLGPVTVIGSVLGGAGSDSGNIYAGGTFPDAHVMTSVTIDGDLRGGGGFGSGSLGAVFNEVGIATLLSIGTISIEGNVIGDASQSASINANNITHLTIRGSLIGSGNDSALIQAEGKLSTLSIKGSIEGGAGGGAGSVSAQNLGSVLVGGDLVGGAGDFSGSIYTFTGDAQSITIGGSVRAGSSSSYRAIAITGNLGSLAIKGDVLGAADAMVILEANGNTTETGKSAIGKFVLNGSATYLQLLAGFTAGQAAPTNSDASIGSIIVGHDWIASSASASGNAGPDGAYGTSDDFLSMANNNDHSLIAKIGSITIKGQLLGTVGGTDNFGFDAQQFGPIKIGAAIYPAPTFGHPTVLGSTGDVVAQLLPPATT